MPSSSTPTNNVMPDPAAKAADQRNLHWKSSNVGATLLGKMGWAEGGGVGKRRQRSSNVESGEGMRVVRRAEGLGLGATASSIPSASSSRVEEFAAVLQSLQTEHRRADDTNKRKRKEKKAKKPAKKVKKQRREVIDDRPTTGTVAPAVIATMTFATNRYTHAKVRQAKFETRSEHDMRCIFDGK